MRRERQAYPRLPAVAGGILLAALMLTARLVWLGTAAAGDAGGIPRSTIRPHRGTIWDRNGIPLATESYVYDLGVATNEVVNPAAVARAVAPLVDEDAAELTELLSETRQRWVPLAKGLEAEAADALAAVELRGIYLVSEPRRVYPLGPTAAHVTGFVNLEGEAFYGVEAYFDESLAGIAGGLAGNFGTDPRSYRPPVHGNDLILTIDRDIQLAATVALQETVNEFSAVGGTIIVLDPRSGELLASASVPTYDPNNVAEADPAWFSDPALSAQYEPGSVIKAMTMAAALDTGVVGVDSTYEDTGIVEVAGLAISNWDRLSHGRTTMSELLTHSLNVGAVHLALGLGSERFYSYLRAFGFGEPTGLDLYGEIPGQVHDPASEADWYRGNLATNSFGQGMAATPMQVAVAFGAIANDGVLIPPRVLAGTVDGDGRMVEATAGSGRRVVAATTARSVRRMLETVVTDRVTKAAIPGYRVAGKTGTSQIPIEGGYDPDTTIASFVGMLPADQPQVVILVKIEKPSLPRGSDVAAPAFREVAREVVAHLDIPPDKPVELAGVTW